MNLRLSNNFDNNTYSSIYSWENVFAKSMYPPRTEKIIKAMLNQSQDILFLDHLSVNAITDKDKQHLLTEKSTLNDLYILYQQYGIDAFKNIQFLAPAYITPTGDIFGTKDISIYGKKNDNYKIIVVQTFNLYQQLMNRYPNEIFRFKTLQHNIIDKPLQNINIHATFIIMIIIIIGILISYIMLFLEKNNIIK